MNIELDNVSKNFKNQTVLENVNLKLESGKIYGLVGRNGSGKSVLLKIMTGLMDSKKVYRKFSLGMKQKLAIAQAFMEEPKVLLLDEPMNALDEQSVQDMRIMFREYVNKKPAIMVITSHHKEDIEILCDQVYSIKNGYVNL